MVFPLYDDNPFEHAKRPYATWTLIAMNVVFFLVMLGLSEAERSAVFSNYGVQPVTLTLSIYVRPVGWHDVTLVTSLFLHGGWEHLLGNMVYLWVFGDDIEDALGPFRFIVFYLLAGILASIVYIALNPYSTALLVGASGAISGVLAAYLMLRPCADVSVFVLRFVIRVRAYWVIGGWALLQIFLLAGKSNDGIAYLAHVGGLGAGAVLFLLLRPKAVRLFQCIDPQH